FSKAGFRIPRFTDSTYATLGEFFNIVGGSYQNPLDMAGTVQGKNENLEKILRIVEADPNIDGLVMELSAMFASRQWKDKPDSLDGMLETMERFMQSSEKPFAVVLHPA